MNRLRILVSMTLMLGMCISMYANPDVTGKKKDKNGDVGTTITLVTSGTGNTKEEATKNALRSALEQTYGAFVSANSQVVNDELVKDEIISISTGNIVSYQELSFIDSTPKQISVSAVVSISRLQTYAQNKGMSAELAGNTFAMNMKMEELNLQNEKKALANLVEQIKLSSSQLFDYKIYVGDPQRNGQTQNVTIPLTYNVVVNANTVEFYKMIHGTLSSLAISKEKTDLLNNNGLRLPHIGSNGINYVLRSGDHNNDAIGVGILRAIERAAFNSEIYDNIGNQYRFVVRESYDREYDGICCYKSKLGVLYVLPTNNKLISKYNRYSNDCIDNWLGANNPKVGDVIWNVQFEIHYTMDEISKISKIEVRPVSSYSPKGSSSPNSTIPGGWKAVAEKGFKLMEDNKTQESYSCFIQACEMAPDNAIIHGYAGILANTLAMNSDNIQNRKTLLSEAVKYLDKAKELNPTQSIIKWGNFRYEAYKNLYGPDDERTKAAKNDY